MMARSITPPIVTPDWKLRLARRDDADFLPDIERSAGLLFEAGPGRFALGRAAELIDVREHRAYIARGRSLVAFVGERRVGFLLAEPAGRALHIVEMSVHADYQRQGIGAGMLRALIVDAGNSGFDALTLTTFTDVPWNAPFYVRLGFVTVDDLQANPRLAGLLRAEQDAGLPVDRRVAMIRFID